MKALKFMDTKAGMVVAVGVVGAVALYFVEKKARESVAAVGDAIDPTNNDNIFASGVNAVGAKLTGNEHFKLGSWVYDLVHGGD